MCNEAHALTTCVDVNVDEDFDSMVFKFHKFSKSTNFSGFNFTLEEFSPCFYANIIRFSKITLVFTMGLINEKKLIAKEVFNPQYAIELLKGSSV